MESGPVGASFYAYHVEALPTPVTRYVREVAGGLVVNSGSVGFPFDGNPQPSFAILELEAGRWSGEIVRTAYDNEAVAQDLLASDHPEADAFARRVRSGRLNP